MSDDNEKVVVEFVLDAGSNVGSFLETVGQNLDYVQSAQLKKWDGFAHWVNDGDKIDFTDGGF